MKKSRYSKIMLFINCIIFILIPVSANAAEARFISQLVPENVSSTQSFTVILQFRNTSGSHWSNADAPVVESIKPTDWGSRQIKMQEKTVRRGEIATFQATLKAPYKPGTYSFQWQIKSHQQGWRDAKSPAINIHVKQDDPALLSEFMIQKFPGLKKGNEYFAIVKRGEVYPITLIFKNRGTKSWSAPEIELMLKNRQDISIWSITHVPLKANESIAPGEVKAFHFNIIAPLKPGIYPFQWQLRRGPTWFGQPSDMVTVTVQ